MALTEERVVELIRFGLEAQHGGQATNLSEVTARISSEIAAFQAQTEALLKKQTSAYYLIMQTSASRRSVPTLAPSSRPSTRSTLNCRSSAAGSRI